MMMECPRCAFVQPQDRFCANCGLNIATYQAKPKPFFQRLIASPAFYLVAGITLAVAVTMYLMRAPVAPSARTGFVTEQNAPISGGGNPQTTPGYSPPPEPPRNPEPEPQGSTTAAFAPPANPPTAPPAPNPAAPAAAADSASTEVAAPAAPKMPAQVEISFYEVPRDAWQPVAADAKPIGESGGWRILQLTQKDKLTSALAGARRLPGQRQMGTQPSSIAQLHFPIGAPESHQGVYFDFSAVKLDDGNLDIEIAGEVALKIDATNSLQSRVDSLASMPAGGAVVLVSGGLRKPVPETLAAQLSNSPLSVLDSPDFMESQSDLILVISGR